MISLKNWAVQTLYIWMIIIKMKRTKMKIRKKKMIKKMTKKKEKIKKMKK